MFCAFCKHFSQPSPASPRIPARANGEASCAGPSRLLLLIDHRIKLTEVPQGGVGGAGPGHHPGRVLETQRPEGTGWPAYLAQPGEARETASVAALSACDRQKEHVDWRPPAEPSVPCLRHVNTRQYCIHHCLATGRSDLEISFKPLLGNQVPLVLHPTWKPAEPRHAVLPTL